MICMDNGMELNFLTVGLFSTDAPWLHPVIAVDSYEIIYVLEGEVRIYEGEERYRLGAGEMLLLYPGIEHGGFGGKSTGKVSFYWLHFRTPDIAAWGQEKLRRPPRDTEKELRALMHDAQTDRRMAEVRLCLLLLQLGSGREYRNRQAYETEEYLRLHAAEPLTVAAVAARFGYSPDHLSRVYRKEFGRDLKSGIVRHRLEFMEARLANTDDTLKSLAGQCGFEDENAFVKFFRYHAGLTPTEYRNRFFRVHRNEK